MARKRIYMTQILRATTYYPPYDNEPALFHFQFMDNKRKVFWCKGQSQDEIIKQIKASGEYVIYDDGLDICPRNGLELALCNRITELETAKT